MKPTVDVYLELGSRRVFAGGLDWPGWCRSGRDEAAALHALAAYARRYEAAVGAASEGFTAPPDASALRVVERLQGNATTDFGAPAMAPALDERPVDDSDLARLGRVLEACWSAFDAAAEAASSAVLRKGPRGGGRELKAIVSHVMEADRAYLASLGGKYRSDGEAEEMMEGIRRAFLETLRSRAHGEPLPPTRRSRSAWSPTYAVRRSAWHALDHAWEIEDRAEYPGTPSD